MFGSMKSGNLRTAKSEREVNAFAGVRSPPVRVYSPNAIIVTRTGMLFNRKLLICRNKKELQMFREYPLIPFQFLGVSLGYLNVHPRETQ